jgi:DNA-binding MarR family transcriptional regulator
VSEVSSVSQGEWETWRAFHAMRRALDLALDRQLQQDAHISGQDFEILLTLFEAPAGHLRARDLGEVLGWEKSRLSHQVTRMVERNLVERTNCDSDARGTWIGVTAEGRRTVLAAMRDHATTVRRLFFDVISESEQATLKSVAVRVLDEIDPPGCAVLDEAVLADGELDDGEQPGVAQVAGAA